MPSINIKLCECGCGQPTELAQQTRTDRGYVAGQPQRFVKGHHNNRNRTLIDAFIKHFTAGEPGTCWEWQGRRASTGYGRVSVNNTYVLAHRASYLVHYGEIPDGMEVCHTCDNPPCVNPNHLFIATHLANMTDASHKGRCHPGELTANAKLTASDVREIRRLRQDGWKLADLAAKFNVSQPNITAILNRQTWRHIE
jgi:hypothetical protein